MLSFRVVPAARSALSLAMAALCAWPVVSTQAQQAEGQTVTVTATRFADRVESLPYGVSVLTARDLQRAGVSSVNEALMRLLGVPGHMSTTGGGEYSLDLRGFGGAASANMVVVVDGMRVSEGDLADPLLAGLAIDSIDRIEVLRGSGAVLYGEGATAGVIAITTRSGARGSEPLNGQVLLGAGTDRLRDARASLAWAQQGLSLDATLARRLSDGHRDNFDAATRASSFALQWRGAGVNLAARYTEDRLNSGLPGDLSAAQARDNPRQSTSPRDRGRLDNRRLALQAGWDLGAGWQLVADGGWRQKASRSVFDFGFGPSSFDYDVDATQWTVRARQQARWGELRNQFAVGFDDQRWRRDVLGSFGSAATQVGRGLFVRDEVTLPGGTRLAAGIRREALRKALDDGFSITRLEDDINAWELSLLQPLAPDWQAYAHLGRSFRLANADEYSFTVPSTDMRPQTSRDAELGLRWRQGASRLEARLWRSALRDEIGFDPSVANPASFTGNGANVNFDRTRRQGVELEARHALSPALSVSGTLGWRQARFTAGSFKGKTVPLVPARNASLGLQWQPLEGHSADLWLRGWSSQFPTMDNACRLGGAAVLDARYAYTQGDWELSLAGQNLGDRRFATQSFGCAGGEATALYPEPGRSFQVALRWRF